MSVLVMEVYLFLLHYLQIQFFLFILWRFKVHYKYTLSSTQHTAALSRPSTHSWSLHSECFNL